MSARDWKREQQLQAEADADMQRWALSGADEEAAAFDAEERRARPAEDDGFDHYDPADALGRALASPSTDPDYIFTHHR